MTIGRCPLCRRVTTLVNDHDHVTGINREAICYGCNAGLGMFRDDSDALRRASEYVRKHALRAWTILEERKARERVEYARLGEYPSWMDDYTESEWEDLRETMSRIEW